MSAYYGSHEQKYIHKECEAQDLHERHRPYKTLPAEAQADDPDAECPARIRQATRRGAHMARHTQTKEVKQAN